MASVLAEPEYRELLREQGLTTCAAVTALPAVVIGCHPDRHVARVLVGAGAAAVPAFLKHERRVSWTDRLKNWWAGFGFVSKSVREARSLRALRAAGVGCPEVMACGEEERGGAFLLVRAAEDFVELRAFVRDFLPRAARRQFARSLGRELARIHAAGFDQPDLYSKHVLVHPETNAVVFLDWQRSRRGRLSPARRCRDLAALDATLGEEWVGPLERLLCLRAYLRASETARRAWPAFAQRIRSCSHRLQGRRRLRELRQEPLPTGAQDLVPLEGGGVYASPSVLAGRTPPREVLGYAGMPHDAARHLERRIVPLPNGRRGVLVRRRVSRPHGWLAAWLRGRAPLSPERQQADALFRLQRYGVTAPRLLAYGQRSGPPWRQESLLLIELPVSAVGLAEWLARNEAPAARRRVLAETWQLLRRMHAAGYFLGPLGQGGELLLVDSGAGEEPRVMLGTVEYLEVRRQPSDTLAARDRDHLHSLVAGAEAECAGVRATLACGAPS